MGSGVRHLESGGDVRRKPMPNARLSERAPFFAEVDVLAAGAPAPRRVWGCDVSETGMFLQTTHPFRVGDRVSLRFDVEKSEVHVRAAEVMWVRPFEPINIDGKMPGVGLRFIAVDPPARAALRRFIQPHLDTRADVTDPGSENVALPSLPPPTSSLPPITGSILSLARGEHAGSKPPTHAEITDEMFAVSLAPFSQPPLSISLPPDESSLIPEDARVFKNTKPMGTPRPVTMLPEKSAMKKASTPPVLAGWSFKKAEEEDVNTTDPSSPALTDEGTASDEQADIPALHMRFDDEGPASSTSLSPQASSAREGPVFDVSSTPPEAVLRDDAGNGSTSGPNARKDLELGRAFEEGALAMRHLPIAEERRVVEDHVFTPRAPRSRALPVAVALLCSGTLVGAGLGWLNKELRRGAPLVEVPAPIATAPVEHPPPAPARTVADVERELQPVTKAEPIELAPLPPAPPAVAKAEVVPPKATKPDDTLTTRVDAPRPVKRGGAVDVKVGAAKVVRSFVLDNPARVVVDLAGATLPKAPLTPGGRIAKVRFGSPAPGVGRVVVEVDGARPRDVEATVRDGELSVTFR
jgi:Tfp pilus assembly protein PilZ